MKLLLIGCTGNIGAKVAHAALTRQPPGSVTLFVRNAAKLRSLLPAELLGKAQIVEADVHDAAALGQAMQGQSACICTAGNAKTGPQFRAIFRAVVDAAVKRLAAPKRLWMMAGVTVTALPGRLGLTLNDLPIFTLLPFAVHTENFRYLTERAASLDWTLMCPGVLRARAHGDSAGARLFIQVAPLWLPRFLLSRCVPRILATAAIAVQMGRFGATLEDVAEAMLDGLESRPELTRERVGLVR